MLRVLLHLIIFILLRYSWVSEHVQKCRIIVVLLVIVSYIFQYLFHNTCGHEIIISWKLEAQFIWMDHESLYLQQDGVMTGCLGFFLFLVSCFSILRYSTKLFRGICENLHCWNVGWAQLVALIRFGISRWYIPMLLDCMSHMPTLP